MLLLVSRSGRAAAARLAQAATAAGARVVAVTQRVGGDLDEIADHVLGLPGSERSVQFGGALFEQVALVVLGAVVFAAMDDLDGAAGTMAANHTNLE